MLRVWSEFTSRKHRKTDEIPNNSIDDDNNGYIDDYDGWYTQNNTDNVPSQSHGTHVSGTVGAKGNNGIGIAAEHHKRIFDSYYKLSDRSDSNGLGLSNVKDAVQKLQGTIEVESTLGLGSIFKIQLPAI